MNFRRKIRHLLWKSKTVSLGLEHFLAMLPATILVPITINALTKSNVIDTSLVLFTSGLGTIAFLICSRLSIPTYIGSSFAFIGLSVYMINMLSKTILSPESAYGYVGWSYLFCGAILIILSFLYKVKKAKDIFNFLLPASVIGPAISLIGLELAESAAQDAGFIKNPIAMQEMISLSETNSKIVALVTLGIIIISTIAKRKILKNSAIVLGMIGGFILSIFLSDSDISLSMFQADLIKVPRFSSPIVYVPPNLIQMLISVIPATLVVFTENISRVTVIARMTDNENRGSIFSDTNIKKFRLATFSHGVATLIAAVCGSVPNTLYAENIAVMGTHSSDRTDDDAFANETDLFIKYCHNAFSCFPYFFAACFAIIASFSGHLQQFLLNIPTPVIGGMKLFLFGIISAPGIQLLVEQRVNYKKISNQLLTASVLLSGISGLTINFGDAFELKGMSLGFVVGMIANIFIKILDWCGKLNDNIEISELFQICVKEIPYDAQLQMVGSVNYDVKAEDLNNLFTGQIDLLSINETHSSSETIISTISDTHFFVFSYGGRTALKIERTSYALYIKFCEESLPENERKIFLHDYRNANDNAVESLDGFISIRVGANVPLRIIKKLMKLIQ